MNGIALRTEALEAGYEPGLPIVRGASIQAFEHQILAILGPNGAGKSTLVKAIAGLVPISAGRIFMHEQDITSLAAHRMIFSGLAFVPQTENVFANLRVRENLELAAAILGRDKHESLKPVLQMFPDLERQSQLRADQLSGGQRQMLAMARALIAKPKVLILDEPSAGLSPKLVGQVLAQLKTVRDSGVTVILVEQNVKAALAIVDQAVVLVDGKEAIAGSAQQVLADPSIAKLYLGKYAGTAQKAGA